MCIVLVLAAIPVRYTYAAGDLWGDEADYALASTYPFALHRWDRSDVPTDPTRLVRLRHYHPPVTALLMRTAQSLGTTEQTLRLPFVLAGSLAVGLIYLCGLALFEGRRDVASACAVIVLLTPLQIRAASHAIPWALITLGLLGLLWTLMQYLRTNRPGWIVSAWGVLGLLFVTTESFFPLLLVCGLSAPLLFWPQVRDRAERHVLLRAMALGIAVFLLIVLVIWPRGLFGGAWQNLDHYIHVPQDSVPVTVGHTSYQAAPKWAYLYWYWHDYRPYFLCYALGLLATGVLAARRKLSRTAGVLLIFTLVELTVAHKAIIPGPHYLAHCLPLLTLLLGLPLLALTRHQRWLGWSVMVLLCAYLVHWQPRLDIRENEADAEVTRWPSAARWLAQRWQPEERLLVGPQPAGVARWYLLHVAGVKATFGQILPLDPGRVRPEVLNQITAGTYRYLILSSPFDSSYRPAPALASVLASARLVWSSSERGKEESRLRIYQLPPHPSGAHGDESPR
jgi:4-amino-4-deoxy-L-arabinose transferase-like glycosyltransferase